METYSYLNEDFLKKEVVAEVFSTDIVICPHCATINVLSVDGDVQYGKTKQCHNCLTVMTLKK